MFLKIPSVYLPSNAILTINYDPSLIYLVSDNYAKVTWKTADGTDIVSEYVSVGVTPKVVSDKVKDYLKNAGGGYSYALNPILDTSDVNLVPSIKRNATVLQSMTINEDLSLYVYLNKNEIDSNVKSVKVNGVRLMKDAYTTVEIDGISYYMYQVISTVPANACREIRIELSFLDGSTNQITTSIVDYLENLLLLSVDKDEKVLAVKILKYIASAHQYFAPSNRSDYERVTNIVTKYKEYDLIFGTLAEEYIATDSLKNSIKSACFNLSASVRIRFYINPEFTGDIEVKFNGVTHSFKAVNGKIDELDYIEVFMSADTINDTVEIISQGQRLEYGLNAYATSLNCSDPVLRELLTSLCYYSSAAKAYLNK